MFSQTLYYYDFIKNLGTVKLTTTKLTEMSSCMDRHEKSHVTGIKIVKLFFFKFVVHKILNFDQILERYSSKQNF